MTTPTTSRSQLLARIGDAMQLHQRRIGGVQWVIVVIYLFFLLAPLFFPAYDQHAPLLQNLRAIAQFLFWGIGWPLIMLSMMLFGRVWCGLFCPDGTLTEFVSRHGQKRSIPRWIRWPGWPCTMLLLTTVYGQLVGVYDFHPATLLLLGLPTAAAVWCGFLYGNGKRIWCMYLCPANGVFGLLAKIAPLYFRVEEEKWRQHPPPLPKIDCPPLIDIRRMKSASTCHACGRCSGYLDAVTLSIRAPDAEILATPNKNVQTTEAITLIFGILGIVTAAMHWSGSRWFTWLKTVISGWGGGALDHYVAPWWLLANYPAQHRGFTLLDGATLLTYLLGGGVLLGCVTLLAIWLSANVSKNPEISWQRLSLGLIPLGGVSIFLGLSGLTVTLLRREGYVLTWVTNVQVCLLLLGCATSMWIGFKLLLTKQPKRLAALALVLYTIPVAFIGYIWLDRYLS